MEGGGLYKKGNMLISEIRKLGNEVRPHSTESQCDRFVRIRAKLPLEALRERKKETPPSRHQSSARKEKEKENCEEKERTSTLGPVVA